MSDWLGWVATAAFTSSYFFKRAGSIRLVQMVGAVMWVVYGVLVNARPVIVANLLVLGAAAAGSWKDYASRKLEDRAARRPPVLAAPERV
jgi:hypothetical protein